MNDNSNPFGQAMMNAGLPEYSKGPRQAFFASDERAKAAGFPLNHPYSHTNVDTGKHMAWIPDTNAQIFGGKGKLEDAYSNPNLYKTYPEARDVQYDPAIPGNAAGAIGLQSGDNIWGMKSEIPHEVQHWVNAKSDLTSQRSTRKEDHSKMDNLVNLLGGDQRYFNSDNEATARLAAELFKYGGDFTPWGSNAMDAMRNNMESLTGNRKFYKEK